LAVSDLVRGLRKMGTISSLLSEQSERRLASSHWHWLGQSPDPSLTRNATAIKIWGAASRNILGRSFFGCKKMREKSF
jgi:hypothetical protein